MTTRTLAERIEAVLDSRDMPEMAGYLKRQLRSLTAEVRQLEVEYQVLERNRKILKAHSDQLEAREEARLSEVRRLERLVEELRAAEDILYSELRRVEAREQARLSKRAYSASPSGCGRLTVPVTSANHCSDWPTSHQAYPRTPGPECEEPT